MSCVVVRERSCGRSNIPLTDTLAEDSVSYANTRDMSGPAGEGGGQSTFGAAMVSALGDRDLTIPKICGNPQARRRNCGS